MAIWPGPGGKRKRGEGASLSSLKKKKEKKNNNPETVQPLGGTNSQNQCEETENVSGKNR